MLSIPNDQPALTIDILIDARDSLNTEIIIELSVHHLDSDTLNDWLIEFDDGNMNLPFITSDGIRMINNELDEDFSSLLDGIPIEEISSSLSELFGSDIQFIEPNFTPPDQDGGLDSDISPVKLVTNHWRLDIA